MVWYRVDERKGDEWEEVFSHHSLDEALAKYRLLQDQYGADPDKVNGGRLLVIDEQVVNEFGVE